MYALKPKRFSSGKLYSFERGHNGHAETVYRRKRPEYAQVWHRSFVLKLQFGPGPGYCRWNADRTKVEVHGWGITLAWHSGSRQWHRRFSTRATSGLGRIAWYTPFELHVGRRANNGFYLSH